MKKIIAFFSSFILIVFLLIINFDYEKSSIVENNITDYKIFIDAGHGGMDPGTYSGNIFEKELNLKIAKKLGDIFIQNNCFIYFSRTEDYDLSKEDSYNHKIDDLKKYIRLKFEKINNIINAFQEIVDGKEKEWSSRKVNRNQDNNAILLDVIDILNERYLDDSDIKELYNYLICDIFDESNIEIVNEYRKIIVKAIPAICDCIDNMDYDGLYQVTDPILNPHLREIYPMMHYQLEKIYCYLNDDGYGNIYWGLTQAELFSKEFAKDWVNISIVGMSFTEIKLLVTIACYYQAQKEVK